MKKKIFYAMVLLVLCVCMCASCSLFSRKEKYLGSNSSFEVVIELDNKNNTFELTETTFRTGLVTVARGEFKKLGTNESVIRFTFDNNVTIQCEILVNIYGTPFISFAGTSLTSYPACYKQ